MVIRKQLPYYVLACAVSSAAVLTTTSAHADNAGAFIGGVFAARCFLVCTVADPFNSLKSGELHHAN